MKKFTLIAALFVSFVSLNSAKAQSFTVDQDTAKGYWAPGGFAVDISVNAIAPTTTPIDITWKIIRFELDPKWKFDGFCDNNLCRYDDTKGLTNGFTSFTTAPFSNAAKANFKVDFIGDSAAINTKALLTIEMTSGTTVKYATLIAYKNTTGITTTFRTDDDISIFPNPASNYIDVKYSSASDVKTIAIYNLIGKVVNVFKVTDKNSAHCEFNADMPSGIYIVRIADSKGNVIATRKITHQ